MNNRFGIMVVALACGYNIRAIVGGAYFLIPAALVLAVLLVWLVLRPTKTAPRKAETYDPR